MTKLVLRLLGPIEAVLNENRIDAFPADKVTALLAYLAVESNVAHPRASLSVLLWPEHTTRKAQGNLRQTLYRLRTTLDQHAPGLSDRLLQVTRRTILLDAGHLWLDVAELLALSGKCGTEDTSVPVEQCRAVADSLRGEFMAGLALKDAPEFDDWQSLTREKCFLRAQSLLYALGERYAREGNYAETNRMARRQLALEPWREEAHRQLMDGLARSGRAHDALGQFESCRKILEDEWGVEPSRETVDLYQAIRAGTLGPEVVQPDVPSLTPAQPKPLLHGFPTESVAFIGRERELDLIASYFAQPSHRLMTIVGIGGMGRRRLASEAAQRLVKAGELFADGAIYVGLDKVGTWDEALGVIAVAVGLTLHDDLPRIDQIVRQLHSLDILLVFSGLERFPNSRRILSALLAETTGVRILSTSFFGMKLPGERTLVLSGLDFGRVMATPAGLEGTLSEPRAWGEAATPSEDDLPIAAKLFVAVARSYRGSWTPSQRDVACLLRISRALEGMPLALTIAAGWTRVMDLSNIARELEANDAALQLEDQDEWNHPRSVSAGFEAAWQHLPDGARHTLAQASLFRNGATIQAIYAVTQTDRQTLAVLVDRGLLRWQENGRTGMLRMSQQVARRKLAEMPGLEMAAIERYENHYLSMVREARDLVLGVVIDEEWLASIVADLENIRRAWRWAVDQGDLVEAANVFHLVSQCFERSARYHEALEMIDHCLTHNIDWREEPNIVGERAMQRLVGVLSAESGWFLWRLNRYEDASDAVNGALALLQEVGEPSDLSFAYLTRGVIEDSQGRYAEARNSYATCLEICEADGNRLRAGRVLNFLGAVTRILGHFDEAVRLHEQSLAIGRHLSDRWGISSTLHNLGIAQQELGRLERARTLYHEAMRAGTSLGDPWARNVAKISLADMEIDAGQFAAARHLLGDALPWAEETGNRWAAALATTVLGRLERIDGDALQAENILSHALDLWRGVGDRRGIARTLCEMGRAALAQQRYTAGAELLNRALELAADLQANALVAEILASMSLLLADSRQDLPAARIARYLCQSAATPRRVSDEIAHIQAQDLPSSSPDGNTDSYRAMDLPDVISLAQEATAQFSPTNLPNRN